MGTSSRGGLAEHQALPIQRPCIARQISNQPILPTTFHHSSARVTTNGRSVWTTMSAAFWRAFFAGSFCGVRSPIWSFGVVIWRVRSPISGGSGLPYRVAPPAIAEDGCGVTRPMVVPSPASLQMLGPLRTSPTEPGISRHQLEVTMRSDEITALFEQQASSYDERWAKTAAIRDGLHFLLPAVFAELPEDARLLCVGAGTGEELAYLANRFPRWRFAAVEPSGAMLDICRTKARQQGFLARCDFHEGYLDSMPFSEQFDAATCFLVSQFIMESESRIAFFRSIARRLQPGAILASSDLASEVDTDDHELLLRVWLNMMAGAEIAPEAREQMRTTYGKDVALLSPSTIESIIESGGFVSPVQFYQAGLIHAWFSSRA